MIQLTLKLNKHLPITIVELCNNADIGVGAVIAFNGHVKNGN